MANLRTNNLSGEQGQNAYRGSVYFPGYVNGTVAEYLSIPDTDDLDIGTGDFTFECWVRAAESSGEYAGIFGMYNYDNAGMLVQINNNGQIRLVNPNDLDQSGSTVIIPQAGEMGDWHHIAATRSGTTLKAFVNGVEEISHTYSNGIDFSNGGSAVIGVTDRTDYPGDYHRSRLTHTLEVTSIARTLARSLALNEDLAEALALGHDIGHPPLGHAGEDTLDELLRDAGGFNHNHQALRIMTLLEQRYPGFTGLNLSQEVLDAQSVRAKLPTAPPPLLETQAVSYTHLTLPTKA